jgi:hypothetical protein
MNKSSINPYTKENGNWSYLWARRAKWKAGGSDQGLLSCSAFVLTSLKTSKTRIYNPFPKIIVPWFSFLLLVLFLFRFAVSSDISTPAQLCSYWFQHFDRDCNCARNLIAFSIRLVLRRSILLPSPHVLFAGAYVIESLGKDFRLSRQAKGIK